MSFMFLEPLIIIDNQWLQKHEAHWRFIDEAMPYDIDFIANIGHVGFHWFFHVVVVFRYIRTCTYSCMDGLRDQKNKTKVCTFWNENDLKRTRQIAHTKILYIRTHYEDIFIFHVFVCILVLSTQSNNR